MRRSALLIALLAVVACKDDKKQQAAGTKTTPDAGKATAPDAGGGKAKGPLLPPAEPPAAATEAACKTNAPFMTPTLRLAAEARQVPADKLDAVAKDLTAALLDQCTADAWPNGLIGCLDRGTQDLDTYRRCFERLPARKRTAWNARLDSILGAAGGTTYPAPPPRGVQGTTFEELCPVFVAEVARFDTCATSMYLPAIEEVYAAARQATADDLIPTDAQPALEALCDERAALVRESTTNLCQ